MAVDAHAAAGGTTPPPTCGHSTGNPHDFWGVYKVPEEPWIYGSDRNGGLYVFKEQGSGSGK